MQLHTSLRFLLQQTPLCPPSITPAPTLTPEPAPVLLPGWESVNIETLCLTIEEDYQRYKDLEVTVAEQNIASLLTHTFSSLGITIADHTGDCPASLVVTFNAVPVSDWYDYTETLETYHCYSGVEAFGSLVLEYPGLDPYSFPLDNTFSPEQQLETCPEAPQPETYFPAIWLHKVILGLVDIWGIQAYFPFLEQEDLRVSVLNTAVSLSATSGEEDFLREKLGSQNEDIRFAALTLLHSLDPETLQQDTIDSMIGLLSDESFLIRSSAIYEVGDLGSRARIAVPILIEMANHDPNPPVIFDALQKISGESFGEDLSAWQQWWQSAKP
ncbi:MAG: HEAT repeat domain-containing protein [Anaerolineales bacterium]|nr:HEAT repeat domain-containing protein [Anaerolineales bacterium]